MNVTHNITEPEDHPSNWSDQRLYRGATVKAWQICGPLLMAVGTVGNILSFVVLCSSAFRRSSLGLILRMLSVVDTSLLWTVLFRTVLLHQDQNKSNDIRNHSYFLCKGHFFAAYFLSHLSSWTIAILSGKRALALVGTMATGGSKKKMAISMTIAVVVLAAVDGHLLRHVRFEVFTLEETTKDCTGSTSGLEATQLNVSIDDCRGVRSRRAFCWLELEPLHRKAWQWLDALLFSLAPFLVIITGNLVVARSIIRADEFRSSFVPSLASSAGGKEVESRIFEKNSRLRNSEDGEELETRMRRRRRKKRKRRRPLGRRAKSSTLMLLVVGLTFLVTTTPLTVHIAVVNITGNIDSSMEFAGCLCSIFYYVGNCTNFVQYCLSGSKFRKSAQLVFGAVFSKCRKSWQSMASRECCYRCSCCSCCRRPRLRFQGHEAVVAGTNKKETEKFSLTLQDQGML